MIEPRNMRNWYKVASRPMFSATQLDTFGGPEGCERKWAFRYVRRVPVPKNKYAEFGKRLHKIAEDWINDGTPPPDTWEGRVFKTGIRHLPLPGKAVAEGKFEWLPDGETFGLVGYMDWVEMMQDGIPRIGDHKTTGDFKWMKNTSDLMENIQAVTYAARVAYQLKADLVRGRWVYYLRAKKTRPARAVDFEMTLPQIAAAWEKVAEIGRRMVFRLEMMMEPEELPYNIHACEAYGGCPFHDICGIDPQERFRALMTQMSLKEKLAARAAQAPAVNPPAEGVAPAPAATPAAPVAAAPAPAPMSPQAAPMSPQAAPMSPQAAPMSPPAAPMSPQAAPMSPQAAPPAAPPAASAPARGPDYAAVATACAQISDGFAAIAAHFRGL